MYEVVIPFSTEVDDMYIGMLQFLIMSCWKITGLDIPSKALIQQDFSKYEIHRATGIYRELIAIVTNYVLTCIGVTWKRSYNMNFRIRTRVNDIRFK